MSKNKKTPLAEQQVVTVVPETAHIAQDNVPQIEFKLKPGRPVVPGSARQKRLAEMEAKRKSGVELKRGRPSDPNSARQKQLKERAVRIEKMKQEHMAQQANAVEVTITPVAQTETVPTPAE